MRYLLDTHIWLWSLPAPDKLNNNVEEVLRYNDNKGKMEFKMEKHQ